MLAAGLLVGMPVGLGHAGGPQSRDHAVDPDADPRRGEAVETVCFSGGLSGFYQVGDKAVVLRRVPGNAFLVRTGHCPNLDAVEGLRIDDPAGCLSRGDRLLVFDTQFPRQGVVSDRPNRCLVMSIHQWREGPEGSE